MLKEFAAYLVGLGKAQEIPTKEINGETYTTVHLERIPTHVDRPRPITVNGLNSLATLIHHELDMMDNLPVYVRVAGPRDVEVFTTLDAYMERDYLYSAKCDAPNFLGGWMTQEEAIIKVRSAFIPNAGTEYLLDLLSRVNKDDGVFSEDNGVSQTVMTKRGASLKNYEPVRPRISLRPYRTFTEVTQPESEFILRVDGGGKIGIIAADGDAWMMEAKANIAGYLETMLAEEVKAGTVVVML